MNNHVDNFADDIKTEKPVIDWGCLWRLGVFILIIGVIIYLIAR